MAGRLLIAPASPAMPDKQLLMSISHRQELFADKSGKQTEDKKREKNTLQTQTSNHYWLLTTGY